MFSLWEAGCTACIFEYAAGPGGERFGDINA